MAQPLFVDNKLQLFFVFVATLAATGLDFFAGSDLDYWVHDAAIVHQVRTRWDHVAVVALDARIPLNVSRIQSLPLFALAADRLISAGAKSVFLDARVPKELEGRIPYASCIEENGEVRWSAPRCSIISAQQCEVLNSDIGNAPLKMSEHTIGQFSMAPFPGEQKDLPNFLLFDFAAADAIPEQGIEALDRLLTRNSPVGRWIDLSDDHAVLRLAKAVNMQQLQTSLADTRQNEICDHQKPCRRIRLSTPVYEIQSNPDQLFLPLSVLASCNPQEAYRMADLTRNKAVIFQATSPTETTDTVITPMTTAITGHQRLTPGAQYLADAVETLLAQDYPRHPEPILKLLLFVCVATISVLIGIHCSQSLLWPSGLLIASGVCALCFFNPLTQLWPVTATITSFLIGALETTGTRLIIGYRQGKLVSEYMPEQVHRLLLQLKTNERFTNTCSQVVVLMSDLGGYTTITGILKEPKSLLNLVNDYLTETSLTLQDKYHGWLESYIGDMVCYYWPYSTEKTCEPIHQTAIAAALELATLQQRFFASVPERYADQFEANTLTDIIKTISAGIALTDGLVAMGNQGPEGGIKKFGILGDPLNLVSRIESLTRLFNTEIIVTADLAETAKKMAVPVRRLGLICVKGRSVPAMLFAMGHADDPRFSVNAINEWEKWLSAIEQTAQNPDFPCPALFQQDQRTIENWLKCGYLTEQGIWRLLDK